MAKQFVAIVATSLALILSAEAGACTCVRTPPRDLRDRVAIVFSGAVESVTHHDYTREYSPLSGQTEWVFRVGQVWKGPAAKTFRILCDDNPSECGCGFQVGLQYLVYASEIRGVVDALYNSNLCMRPAPIEEAVWDRAVLGDSVVLDVDLCRPAPTIEELGELAKHEDEVGREARRALQDLAESNSGVAR